MPYLLCLVLLEVELGLLTLKNVSFSVAALAGARGDGDEDVAGGPVGAAAAGPVRRGRGQWPLRLIAAVAAVDTAAAAVLVRRGRGQQPLRLRAAKVCTEVVSVFS